MKLKVYSIFDKAAKAYNTPFFMHNKALALRAFEDNVNSAEENNISKHPEQFSLFCLGEYDDSKGTFELLQQPELEATALELVKPTEETELITQIKALQTQLATALEK